MSVIRYSAATGGFYRADVHTDLPVDAVPVTELRYQQLLAGQATGRRIVAGDDGRPGLTPIVRRTAAGARVVAIANVRDEARRRILAIAGLARQANDAAALALGQANPDYAAALARRARIDAVRAVSNAMQAELATWSLAALDRFEATTTPAWPKD